MLKQKMYEPIEMEWFKVMKININIDRTFNEEELFEVYQKRISEIDHEETAKWNDLRELFGQLTPIERQIFERVYDEKRSMINLAHEGMIKVFGLDDDDDESKWCAVTCEYD